MPYATHIRITALGALGTAAERFSYGINMAGAIGGFESVPSPEGNDALWDDVAADVVAFHTSPGANIQPYARLEEVKIAAIGPDGKYLSDPYIAVLPGSNGTATASPFVLPQTAMAVSLNTDRRGPSGKGRFYVPMWSGPINGSTLLASQTDSDGLRNAAVTLINALNNQPGFDAFPDFKVVVASTKGFNSPVTSVRVGRVVDTIRSRRRQLSETYGDDAAVAS